MVVLNDPEHPVQTPLAEAPLTRPPDSVGDTPTRFQDYVELTKPRITLMVVITAAVGLLMAARFEDDLDRRLAGSWFLLALEVLAALVGTALLAAGASALNMWAERATDGLMRRTAGRPLPSGRLEPQGALETGVSFSAAGAAALFFGVNGLTALLGVTTLVLYVFVYTPLKRVTPWNTHVGTVPGALPILMGATAWNPTITSSSLVLFALLLVWQLPHFFAIDWLYREDYRAGGYRMLSSSGSRGVRSGVETVLFTLILIAISFSPTLMGVTGWFYPAVAGLLGALFLMRSVNFARHRDAARARSTMLASVLYLPAVLGALVLDALVLSGWVFS